MSDPFAQLDAPKSDPYGHLDAPKEVMSARTPDGSLKGDPFYLRALRTVDDFARSAANGVTFGGADRIAGAMDSIGNGKSIGDNTATEQFKSAQTRTSSPAASILGSVAGSAVGLGKIAGAIKAIKGLGSMTLPSVAANAAATGAIGSGLDDAVGEGKLPDPKKAAISALTSAAGGALIHGGAKLISPSARVRSAGAGLSEADKAGAASLSNTASDMGVPLTVPEAVSGASPAASAKLDAVYNTARSSPGGSQIASSFHAMRAPKIASAANSVASDISTGTVPPGFNVHEAAKGAIASAKDLVRKSAEPYYKAAEPVLVNNVPKTAAITEAAKSVSDNARKMEEIGKFPPNSIKFLDAVKKQLDTKGSKVVEHDPYHASLIYKDAGELTKAMDAASSHYAVGRNMFEQGTKSMIAPMEAGPIGTMSKTVDPTTQANAMFNVATPEAQKLAMNAAQRLPEGVPQGLFAHRLSEMASRDPSSIGTKLLPTQESDKVAAAVLSPAQKAKVDDLIKVMKSVGKDSPAPYDHVSTAHGPMAAAWNAVRHAGGGKTVSYLNDPYWISQLNKMGGVQKGVTDTSTALSNELADVNVSNKPARRRRAAPL